jgi:UDP-3-O-[3-hydroxymyristoyl] N-acetylglucosamine deacetylase/3-hydroxyacyl-[acyl-carrier-protein] dehydratase
MVKQTIKTEISLTGVLHTGKEVKMTFKPALINNGFCQSRPEGQPPLLKLTQFC